MRLWMVDPKIMCRKHLLGEHLETHMFVGSLNRGTLLFGYVANNLFQRYGLRKRHDALVVEMKARGYGHYTELPHLTQIGENALSLLPVKEIDVHASLEDLISRCDDCNDLWQESLQEEVTRDEGW